MLFWSFLVLGNLAEGELPRASASRFVLREVFIAVVLCASVLSRSEGIKTCLQIKR